MRAALSDLQNYWKINENVSAIEKCARITQWVCNTFKTRKKTKTIPALAVLKW